METTLQIEGQEQVVLVSCTSHFATRIAGYMINPGPKPTEIPLSIYNANKATFDHYEKKDNVINILMPEDEGFKDGVERLAILKQLAEEEMPRGQRPLKPYVIDTRRREPETMESSVTVKSPKEIAEGTKVATTCMAVNKDGHKCGNERKGGFKVCASHLGMIKKTRTVNGIKGELLSLSDVTIG